MEALASPWRVESINLSDLSLRSTWPSFKSRLNFKNSQGILPGIIVHDWVDFLHHPSKDSLCSACILVTEEQVVELSGSKWLEQVCDLAEDVSDELVNLSVVIEMIEDIDVEVNNLVKGRLDLGEDDITFSSY